VILVPVGEKQLNFATQGRIYIDRLKIRNRRPIKPASIAAFESYLRNHVVPHNYLSLIFLT
jgi:hypothetical protein